MGDTLKFRKYNTFEQDFLKGKEFCVAGLESFFIIDGYIKLVITEGYIPIMAVRNFVEELFHQRVRLPFTKVLVSVNSDKGTKNFAYVVEGNMVERVYINSEGQDVTPDEYYGEVLEANPEKDADTVHTVLDNFMDAVIGGMANLKQEIGRMDRRWDLMHFFKTEDVFKQADVVAVYRQRENDYYMARNRYGKTHVLISVGEFRQLLVENDVKTPLVLTDAVININTELMQLKIMQEREEKGMD